MRCRWCLADHKLGSTHVWFHLHRGCQVAGLAALVAGFAIAVSQFDGTAAKGIVFNTHKTYGIVIFALACLQVGSHARSECVAYFVHKVEYEDVH